MGGDDRPDSAQPPPRDTTHHLAPILLIRYTTRPTAPRDSQGIRATQTQAVFVRRREDIPGVSVQLGEWTDKEALWARRVRLGLVQPLVLGLPHTTRGMRQPVQLHDRLHPRITLAEEVRSEDCVYVGGRAVQLSVRQAVLVATADRQPLAEVRGDSLCVRPHCVRLARLLRGDAVHVTGYHSVFEHVHVTGSVGGYDQVPCGCHTHCIR